MNLFTQIISFLKGFFKKKPEEAPPQQTETAHVVKRLKESYQFFYNEGLTHLKSGDNQKAIAAFSKAIELKGNLKEAYCSRGTALYKTGKENDALNDFMKAIDIDPEYEKAYYNLAAIKIAAGDRPGAIEDLSAILEIDPWNARIYFERASLKAQLGDNEGARADFAQSIQLDPSYADTFINETGPESNPAAVHENSADEVKTPSSPGHHSGTADDIETMHRDAIDGPDEVSDSVKDKKLLQTDESEDSAKDIIITEEKPLKKFEAGSDEDQVQKGPHKNELTDEGADSGAKKAEQTEEAWADDSKPRTYADAGDDPEDLIKKALADFSAAGDPDELKTLLVPEEPEELSTRKFTEAEDLDLNEPSSDRNFPEENETIEPEKKRKIDFETVYEDEKPVQKNNKPDGSDSEEDFPESSHSSLNNNDLESFVKDVNSLLGNSTNKIAAAEDFTSPHAPGKTPQSFEYEDEKEKNHTHAGPSAFQDDEADAPESKFNVRHEEQETESTTPRYKMNKKTDPVLEKAQEFYDSGVQKAKLLDFDGAVDDFTKAIELVPKHAYSHLSRGKIKAGMHDFSGAMEDYTKAISFEGKFAEAYFCRANLYVEMGNITEALNDYSKAIDSNARFIVAYFNRGLLQYKSGNYKEAIRDYTKAIIFDPRYAEAYLNRGLANYCINKAKAACEDWLKAAQYGIKQAEELIIRYAPREDIRKNRK